MVSEIEYSYNQIQMDKWNPVIEVRFIFEKSVRRLGLAFKILELLSVHMLTPTNFFWPQLDKA